MTAAYKRLAAALAVINKIAPKPIDADFVRVFANPNAPKVMLTFFKQGCFVQRCGSAGPHVSRISQ